MKIHAYQFFFATHSRFGTEPHGWHAFLAEVIKPVAMSDPQRLYYFQQTLRGALLYVLSDDISAIDRHLAHFHQTPGLRIESVPVSDSDRVGRNPVAASGLSPDAESGVESVVLLGFLKHICDLYLGTLPLTPSGELDVQHELLAALSAASKDGRITRLLSRILGDSTAGASNRPAPNRTPWQPAVNEASGERYACYI